MSSRLEFRSVRFPFEFVVFVKDVQIYIKNRDKHGAVIVEDAKQRFFEVITSAKELDGLLIPKTSEG